MAKQTFKIEGLSDLDDALKQMADELSLSKATMRNTVDRAFKKIAAPFVADAQARAPRLTGKLAESVAINTRLSKRQKSLLKKESDFEIYAGTSAMPHAHLQEFGTSFHGPHPFMRPAWDGNKMKMLESFTDIMREEVEKTRARAARKAERLAAKIKAGG